MVSFDASVAGTSAAAWRAAIAERDIPMVELDAERIAVVAAHPDDETLGAAGLIAAAAEAGIPVEVIVVTDGGASHPGSPTHRPEQLVEIRAAEVRAAVAELNPPAAVTMLGYPDGQAAEFRTQIAADLAPRLSAPGTLVVAPWRGDGHRDHRVVGEIAASMAESLLEYPIWMWHWATPDDAPWGDLRSLTVDPERKRAALAHHRSQVAPLSDAPGDEVVLREDFLECFHGDAELFVATTRLPAGYFDDLYARHDDPWGFESRWYEQRKRDLTLASLPEASYGTALEIGCSTGLVTERLAARCDSLLAVDIADAALERARERVGDAARIEHRDVATDYPAGSFDLVVLSEVGYYFSESVLDGILAAIAASLTADGTLVACHWRHPVNGYLLSGDVVHERIAALGMPRVARHEEEDFVLEVFRRSGDSVARREGML